MVSACDRRYQAVVLFVLWFAAQLCMGAVPVCVMDLHLDRRLQANMSQITGVQLQPCRAADMSRVSSLLSEETEALACLHAAYVCINSV